MVKDFPPTTYQTSDTSLAVYLYTEGFQIADIDYSSERAVIIFLNNNSAIRDCERLYHIGKTSVDASTYSRNFKRLSRIIRNKIPWAEGI